MHAMSDLRVVLTWMIAGSGCSGSVIAAVISLVQHILSQQHYESHWNDIR